MQKKSPKAAWEMVCLPKKNEEALGVLNLRTQIEALLLKHLHKLFKKVDIPRDQFIWERHYSNGTLPSPKKKVSYWCRDILKLLDSFKGMTTVHILDGASYLFGMISGLIEFPNISFLSSFPLPRKKTISLRSVLEADGPATLFHMPISNVALQQLIELAEDLNNL